MARTAMKQKSGPVDTKVLEFDSDLIKKREEEVAQETDEQIYVRLGERFEILNEMTDAVKRGDVRAMIVSGPPGVGKSFGVESVLEKADLFNKIAQRKPKYEVVKGATSAIGLYAKLYEFADPNSVIVFDDCDTVFFDDVCLNLLKAALDTSNKRWINWNTDSRLLRSEGIPDRFEFKGSIIFISNIKFGHVKSRKLRDHLAALESRCHYIDLEMDTEREKILRIKQVVNQLDMLAKYEFEDEQKAELVTFVEKNKSVLRELSLRTVLKLADLRKAFPNKWRVMAKTTLMKR